MEGEETTATATATAPPPPAAVTDADFAKAKADAKGDAPPDPLGAIKEKIEEEVKVHPPGSQAAGRALIEFADYINVLSCSLYAKKQGFNPEGVKQIVAQARYSKDEKETLMMVAPRASVYILALLNQLDKIAACAFGVVFVMYQSDRFSQIKTLAMEAKAKAGSGEKKGKKARLKK